MHLPDFTIIQSMSISIFSINTVGPYIEPRDEFLYHSLYNGHYEKLTQFIRWGQQY